MPARFHHYYSLRSNDVLPFFDGIFAVAFTFLSVSIPEELRAGHEGVKELMLAISGYILSGVAVLLYWYKLRRLVQMASQLRWWQLLLCFVSLLVIVTLPKLGSLAFRYGQGSGNFADWTPSQVANMAFLAALLLFDGLVLLFALCLRAQGICQGGRGTALQLVIRAQTVGFLILLLLAGMELVFTWFNSQYVLLVPVVLFIEEVLVARRFAAS